MGCPSGSGVRTQIIHFTPDAGLSAPRNNGDLHTNAMGTPNLGQNPLTNEVMGGWHPAVGARFSAICIGLLQDFGYPVDYADTWP